MKAILGVLLLMVVLSSCYTAKKASRQMDRAFSEHEVVAANKCANWYPVISDSIIVADTIYIESGNIDYTSALDSLYDVAMRKIKPLPANDTCAVKLAPYISKINDLQGMIIQLRNNYKAPDSVYGYINTKTTVTKENTALSRAAIIERDKLKGSASKWKLIGIVFIGISIILVLILLLRRSRVSL